MLEEGRGTSVEGGVSRRDPRPSLAGESAAATVPVIPALGVRGIEKSFGARKVLDGVSLDVASGEVVGLLGPNGAGKTICFYGIVGLTRLDGGRILLGGEDVTSLTMSDHGQRGLGYLPQEASIFRGMTVEENIRSVLEHRLHDRAAISERVDALLAEFNISHIRDTPAPALSGGERRRCEIARAMAADPGVMLLDEPFAGIDPLSIADIKTMVHELKERGVGVLITDHNVHEMLELVGRAYVIHGGKVLFAGEPYAVLNNPEVRRFYLGEDFEP
ncbi:LPS export ABC transporter ATP-binding protein [Sphingobium sp. DC-2]|uniref:LPS export ABC transporter ATP-binding protein n=1 Tax=Sphingobium sp. DC-2 TaxID=1303256 RepID=UPI0009DDB89E|nr:LPS export ABC transporter ATP-binding protein [Sphingobium sp. DC-2]